jgi:hypothetical protein
MGLKLKNKCNVLVLEEQSIVAYDIQKQLEKSGCNVLNQKTMTVVLEIISKRMPDIIVGSVGLIRKLNNGNLNIIYSNSFHRYINSDTVIITLRTGHIKRFPKPFDTMEIVDFINNYMSGILSEQEYENLLEIA